MTLCGLDGHPRDGRLSSVSGQGKLRVVYLDHVAILSGGELALLRTLPALTADVHPTVILGEDGPLKAKLEEAGIDVRVLEMSADVRNTRRDKTTRLSTQQVRALFNYIKDLRRLLKDLDPDIIHTNSLKAALYGGVAGRSVGVPVLWHVRDRIADDYLPGTTVHLVRLAARVLPTAIVANSSATLATLPRGGTVLASPVVPDGVVLPEATGTRPARPVTIGLVGRLSPWKGQDVFLRAFAQAFPDGQERAHLIGSAMFGEADWETELHGLVQHLGLTGRVDFRGFREDVWAEYAELDIAVHASTTPEPFGQVVLEAMAAGVPVIAADEGGPAEIIQDGVDGLLVTPRNPVRLAHALVRLAHDEQLRAQLAEAGRSTALRYSPERTAQGLLRVYRDLVGPKGSDRRRGRRPT